MLFGGPEVEAGEGLIAGGDEEVNGIKKTAEACGGGLRLHSHDEGGTAKGKRPSGRRRWEKRCGR